MHLLNVKLIRRMRSRHQVIQAQVTIRGGHLEHRQPRQEAATFGLHAVDDGVFLQTLWEEQAFVSVVQRFTRLQHRESVSVI